MNESRMSKTKTVTSKALLIGIRPVQEALLAGHEIDKILIRKGLQGELFQELWQQIKDLQIPFQYVPVERIEPGYPKESPGHNSLYRCGKLWQPGGKYHALL
ncbi:MAG: RNA methyltransferase substrate-binding domain-containing protein [Owenweeksia sp.]|nr:RNA methyltransferase substrate-binding domain-containing protein [Owenweeksia sp.]